MRLTNLTIDNYKSLKSVSIEPERLTLLVGANASGKSNFTDCLDFVSEVYRHGLEVAVSRKGGYDNIAFRKVRRSKSPIRISVCAELEGTEFPFRIYDSEDVSSHAFRIQHTFSFVAQSYSIDAEFSIVDEKIIVEVRQDKHWDHAVTVVRKQGDFDLDTDPKFREEGRQSPRSMLDRALDFGTLEYFKERGQRLSSTELLVNYMGIVTDVLFAFSHAAGGIRTFQISPGKSREFGVPTPRPELDRYGGNLPAVVDTMKKRNFDEWKLVMQVMRNVVPSLQDVKIDYTTTRRLGLFFKEKGFGRPWSVDEVSDGTIQTLALLVALFDTESTVLVIEEPENSVHPWIIRHIIDACAEASKRKQIIITTHSPIVMDAVKPEQMWVVWRSNGESHISKISGLDSDFLSMWREGHVSTFEYVDSGALDEAIPPAPVADIEFDE